MDIKKGILAVSFGSTCDRAREEEIEGIEKDWTKAFPEYTLRRAFTSNIVCERLKERGIHVQKVLEALEDFRKEGYTHIWVQPTHLIRGEEYDRLRGEITKWEDRFSFLKLGEPLLVQEEDYDTVVTIMKERFLMREGEVCIFMGHGTYHQANRVYEKIEKLLEKEDERKYYMATVEGIPSLEDILALLDREGKVRKVTLVPFMLVAGEHAIKDMAGEEETSWKNRCRSHGYEVECFLQGMGSYEEIRSFYRRKCRKCLGGIFYGISVGPGAGGNLTLDAVARIRKCEVLAVPRTGSEHTIALSIVQRAGKQLDEMFGDGYGDYMGLEDKEVLYLDFLMTKDDKARKRIYSQLVKKITAFLEAGKNVGMIVLGDVTIYATVSYLSEPIRRAGFEVTLLPGVSSFCACGAVLGKSLTTMSKPLHIIPAGYEGMQESLELPGSKVLMKSGKNLPETKRILKEMGLYERASMVKDCGMDSEEICWGLDEDTERNSYFTTIVIPENGKE